MGHLDKLPDCSDPGNIKLQHVTTIPFAHSVKNFLKPTKKQLHPLLREAGFLLPSLHGFSLAVQNTFEEKT